MLHSAALLSKGIPRLIRAPNNTFHEWVPVIFGGGAECADLLFLTRLVIGMGTPPTANK